MLSTTSALSPPSISVLLVSPPLPSPPPPPRRVRLRSSSSQSASAEDEDEAPSSAAGEEVALHASSSSLADDTSPWGGGATAPTLVASSPTSSGSAAFEGEEKPICWSLESVRAAEGGEATEGDAEVEAAAVGRSPEETDPKAGGGKTMGVLRGLRAVVAAAQLEVRTAPRAALHAAAAVGGTIKGEKGDVPLRIPFSKSVAEVAWCDEAPPPRRYGLLAGPPPTRPPPPLSCCCC